jgi:vacuolar-type H+-ATPase subunit D/Vma8
VTPCGRSRSSSIDDAGEAYRRALTAAARHAAVVAAVAAVESEIATTRQRVHALERRRIPQLEAAAARVRLQMAELEDADAVRRRRVRHDT